MQPFRVARESDVDAVLEMMRSYYAEDGYPFTEMESRKALSDLMHDAGLGRLWVARDDDRTVGYLAVTLGFSLEYQGRDAFIDELYIAESHRGRGLGHAALELAEAFCRDQKVGALHLEVERHRRQAIRLYRQQGFLDGDRHLMTKRLDDQKAGSNE